MLTRYSMLIRLMQFRRLFHWRMTHYAMSIRLMQFRRLFHWRMTHNRLIKPCVFLLLNRWILVREVPHPLSTSPAHPMRRPLPLPAWQIVYNNDLMLSIPRSATGLRSVSSDQHMWTIKQHLLRSLVVR